jgi:hypothetical protein
MFLNNNSVSVNIVKHSKQFLLQTPPPAAYLCLHPTSCYTVYIQPACAVTLPDYLYVVNMSTSRFYAVETDSSAFVLGSNCPLSGRLFSVKLPYNSQCDSENCHCRSYYKVISPYANFNCSCCKNLAT